MKNKEVKHIKIDEIKDPSFLKSLKDKELELLGQDIRNYIIDSVSKCGGHLSSNLGSSDAIIAMCKAFDCSKDKILFDVGHQSYTYKVLTGRKLDNLRQKNGPSGYQRRGESPFDYFEAGHSSTSISAANGMAIARDLKNEKYDIVAFIGDSSIVNGLAFEGLNNAVANNHKIIIVLNDNDMSISKPVGGMSKFFRNISTSSLYLSAKRSYKKMMFATRAGMKIYNATWNFKNKAKHFLIPTTLFDNLGYTYIGPISGHNYHQMEKAFKKAKKSNKSVVIHLRTKKGYGYTPAENDNKGCWHGVSPFDIETGKNIKTSDSISWSKFYADLINKNMGSHENLVLITPATIQGSSLEEVFENYPTRAIDVGIAEEHAVTMSSGLALNGFHPIISMYSSFLQRAYDEISHDLARMNLDSTILIDRAGLVGADGKTHQGIYDESFLLGIPNVIVAMASNEEVAEKLFTTSIEKSHGVFAIRYPRESIVPVEQLDNKIELSIGKWLKIKEGKNIALVGVGPNVRKVAGMLEEDITIYDAVYQSPMDEKVIEELLKYEKIIIYDSYATLKGFPSILAARLMKLSYKGEVIIKSIPLEFVPHASIEEQQEQFEISPKDIVGFIKNRI
jgi:1-deoxy-D-xylulose-5-phosphate synthase